MISKEPKLSLFVSMAIVCLEIICCLLAVVLTIAILSSASALVIYGSFLIATLGIGYGFDEIVFYLYLFFVVVLLTGMFATFVDAVRRVRDGGTGKGLFR